MYVAKPHPLQIKLESQEPALYTHVLGCGDNIWSWDIKSNKTRLKKNLFLCTENLKFFQSTVVGLIKVNRVNNRTPISVALKRT